MKKMVAFSQKLNFYGLYFHSFMFFSSFKTLNFGFSEALHIVNFIKDLKMIKIIYQIDKHLLNFAYRDVKSQ